jgi:actin related protein 2/3 complex subunit 1A/1B
VYYPDTQATSSVLTTFLPNLSVMFMSEDDAIAVGHDCTPILFTGNQNKWCAYFLEVALIENTNDGICRRVAGKADDGKKASGSATNSALAKFRAMDSRATTLQDSELSTMHQNSIRYTFSPFFHEIPRFLDD